MKKTHKRTILFLIMLSLVLSTGTFAFWATTVEGTTEDAIGTLSIGYAEGVKTTFDLTDKLIDGGLLVPEGQTINSEDAVEEINLSYNLLWKEDTDQSQLVGTTTIGKISVSHSFIIELDGVVLNSKEYSQIYDLINVEYSEENPASLTLDGEVENFSFKVTMDEPNNQADYKMISNAKISIEFNYQIFDNFIETGDTKDRAYVELTGESIVYLEISDTYKDAGAKAYNSLGEEIKGVWSSGGVNNWKTGTYTMTYSAYSSYDNETITSQTRTVIVVDTTSPVISLSGADTINIKQGTTYSDWGAWAKDNSGEVVKVTVSGLDTLDTDVVGTYYITFSSTDSSGNQATRTRTVIVN